MSHYEPVCSKCDEDGRITLATELRNGEDLCEDCAQSQDEAAYERSLSDYYGVGSAVTINEQHQAARRERAEARRR